MKAKVGATFKGRRLSKSVADSKEKLTPASDLLLGRIGSYISSLAAQVANEPLT
jgi:hypothetical protein